MTIDVVRRFYEVIDQLISSGTIRGVNTYCAEYGIDRRHFYHQKDDFNKGYFEVYWILPLIRDFRVSSDWILFGKGEMFRKKRGPAAAVSTVQNLEQ